jgi:hypothetical protein
VGVVTAPLVLDAKVDGAFGVASLEDAVPLAGVCPAGIPGEGGGVAVVVAGGVEPPGRTVPVELAPAGIVAVPPAAVSEEEPPAAVPVVEPPAGVPVVEPPAAVPVVEPPAGVPVVEPVASALPVLELLGSPVPCP